MKEPTDRRFLVRWEVTGALFVILTGSALHFVYGWTGQWRPVALIAAVNESVWEHLKLAFWPYLCFAAIEYGFVRRKSNNFWTAKAAGSMVMPVVIVSVFYGYTAAAGTNYLVVDIMLFVAAVIAGHVASYAILRTEVVAPAVRVPATTVIVGELAAFSLFTFYPPTFFLFQDPVHGHYGIP